MTEKDTNENLEWKKISALERLYSLFLYLINDQTAHEMNCMCAC